MRIRSSIKTSTIFISDPNQLKRVLILASGSPRRREILSDFGIVFQTQPSRVPEDGVSGSPEKIAKVLAERKASAIPFGAGQSVLGADTVLDLDGQLLGKPRDVEDAEAMLLALSDRWHSVITAIAILSDDLRQISAVQTRVKMKPISPQEARAYVKSGEPLDKAGAYAIQGHGAALIECIEGCYLNVVGLPVCELKRLLARTGATIPERICGDSVGQICPRELALDLQSSPD